MKVQLKLKQGFEVQHVIEDGALVAVHSKLEMQMNNKLTILAVVHICRLKMKKLRSFLGYWANTA